MAFSRKLKKIRSYWFQVPWCVPAWGWAEFRVLVRSLFTASVRRGRMPEQFAESIKIQLGRRFAVPLARGREGIRLALETLHVQPGDEVVLQSYICTSVLEAVVQTGATPVFADIDETLHATPRTIDSVLTPKTKCVIVAHLFGNTAPIDEIEAMLRRRGIPLIDDAAQGLGARRNGRPIGSFGEFGIICGGPGKPLATPAGALLVMDDPELYREAARTALPLESSSRVLKRTLGFWFWRRFRRYTVLLEAVSQRLFGENPEPACNLHAASNLDSALLWEQLTRLNENRQVRERAGAQLAEMFEPLGWHRISHFEPDAIPLKLVLLLPEYGPNIDEIIEQLAAAGIECQTGYRPCRANIHHPRGQLTNTEALWRRVLCLPIESSLRNRESLARLIQSGALQTNRAGLEPSVR